MKTQLIFHLHLVQSLIFPRQDGEGSCKSLDDTAISQKGHVLPDAYQLL